MKSLRDYDVKGKRVLIRCDFNVPLDAQGKVVDDFRIIAVIPTIAYCITKGARVVLMSHLGHPEGKVVQSLSLENVHKKLIEYLGPLTKKAPDCVGKDIELQTKEMKVGEVLLLENLRFHKEEEENDAAFARQLSQLGDVYVNDAFGVAHRSHASVVGVPRILPAFTGFLLEKEIQGLERLLQNPEHPMVAVVGGRKIESKLPVIDRIAKLADSVLLGNLLANELKAKNIQLEHAEKVLLPPDGVSGQGKEFDIGPETRELYKEKIREARTIFWAGPLGKYEEKEYAQGSLEIAKAILEDTSYAVAGGGNLLDFLGRYELREKFDHISTGGSAMLAFLAGEQLPGLKALSWYER
tara:strand:- start:1306 stop:2367 length:1062 start_codon:yes stop_codon:yes gene_type:complete